MSEAQKTLTSAIMYLRSKYAISRCRPIYRCDRADYDAIRLLEAFYVIAQMANW